MTHATRLTSAILAVLFAASPLAADDEIGLLELFNYYEYSGSLASSGQPTREQLPAVAAAGIEAVINLAPATEPMAYADEGERVQALQLDYVHIPVAWENPTRDDLDRFYAAMQRFSDKKVLVHCYANARASAFTYLWRVNKAQHDPAEAYATLRAIWDLNEGYELDNVPVWSSFIAAATASGQAGTGRDGAAGGN